MSMTKEERDAVVVLPNVELTGKLIDVVVAKAKELIAE